MGTNFYWIVQEDGHTPAGDAVGASPSDMDPNYHLGKRSAAGWYCYDCRTPLVEGGERAVHSDTALDYEQCPKCGAGKPDSGTFYNTAMVELGFAVPATTRLTGVQTASSFSWAQDPERVLAVCAAYPQRVIITDEYERTYTGSAFQRMLDSGCPIRFTGSIGDMFS